MDTYKLTGVQHEQYLLALQGLSREPIDGDPFERVFGADDDHSAIVLVPKLRPAGCVQSRLQLSRKFVNSAGVEVWEPVDIRHQGDLLAIPAAHLQAAAA